MGPLDDLVDRYLSPAVVSHCENSSVEFVVDGRGWMRRMRELLTSLGPGDAAYICGLQLEPDMDLTGRRPGERGHEPRVAYALALVQGRLYQRSLRDIDRSDLPKDVRAQRRRDIEQRYREPTLR